LENSSLHTSVPEVILGAKAWLAIELAVSPERVATAFNVTFEVNRNGVTYAVEFAVGVLPSSV
jgi:hypothetical protein